MEYELWRQDVFGQSAGTDPVEAELTSETYSCANTESFDHIDRALVDDELHTLFTKEQIGIGLNLIYSNSCSDLPFCYVEAGDEQRRLTGIANLIHLYRNYFARYCSQTVNSIGNDQHDGKIGFICYMLWDVFVLYPGNATPRMVDATLQMMDSVIHSNNENCIVSVIHGLGHWVPDTADAATIIRKWLRKPTTSNTQIIDYAKQAMSGCIL
jgi:hypothetical protein